jgi:hypothetical protein
MINQIEYIKQTLIHFAMTDCNPKFTTTSSGADLFNNCGKALEDPGLYLSMIGRLIYLSTHSRPDITFIVNRLCSFMKNSTDYTLNLAKHVLKYLKATINYNLIYISSKENNIKINCDADYANDQ